MAPVSRTVRRELLADPPDMAAPRRREASGNDAAERARGADCLACARRRAGSPARDQLLGARAGQRRFRVPSRLASFSCRLERGQNEDPARGRTRAAHHADVHSNGEAAERDYRGWVSPSRQESGAPFNSGDQGTPPRPRHTRARAHSWETCGAIRADRGGEGATGHE